MATCCLAFGFRGDSSIKRHVEKKLTPLIVVETLLIVTSILLVAIGRAQYNSAFQHIMLRGRTTLFIGCGILGSITFLIGLGGAIHYYQVFKGTSQITEESHQRTRDTLGSAVAQLTKTQKELEELLEESPEAEAHLKAQAGAPPV